MNPLRLAASVLRIRLRSGGTPPRVPRAEWLNTERVEAAARRDEADAATHREAGVDANAAPERADDGRWAPEHAHH